MKLRHVLFFTIFFIPYFAFSQTQNSSALDLGKLNKLKKGIYLSFEEFKTNTPSIIGDFEVTNKNPNYILYPEENNKYFIKYYNDLGGEVNTNLEGIWGFNDGYGIYIIYQNRPTK